MIRLAAAVLLLFAVVPAAQAKTMKDCEKIQNPMEFNLCLASLAPERGVRAPRGTRPPANADIRRGRTRYPTRPVESDISYDPLVGDPFAPRRSRSGRKSLEFTVSGKR